MLLSQRYRAERLARPLTRLCRPAHRKGLGQAADSPAAFCARLLRVLKMTACANQPDDDTTVTLAVFDSWPACKRKTPAWQGEGF